MTKRISAAHRATRTGPSAGAKRTGPGELRVVLVPIDEIKFRPRNAKKHGDVDVAEIASSLDRFDQNKNVVLDAQGYCVAGEGTVRAAASLGWTHVWAKSWDAARDETRAYALADNRVAELAPVDYRLVAEELQDLSALGAPVEGLGWDERELAALLGAQWAPAPVQAASVEPERRPAPEPVLAQPRLERGQVEGTAPAQDATEAPPARPAAQGPGRWVHVPQGDWDALRAAVEHEAARAGVSEGEAMARLALRGAGLAR